MRIDCARFWKGLSVWRVHLVVLGIEPRPESGLNRSWSRTPSAAAKFRRSSVVGFRRPSTMRLKVVSLMPASSAITYWCLPHFISASFSFVFIRRPPAPPVAFHLVGTVAADRIHFGRRRLFGVGR